MINENGRSIALPGTQPLAIPSPSQPPILGDFQRVCFPRLAASHFLYPPGPPHTCAKEDDFTVVIDPVRLNLNILGVHFSYLNGCGTMEGDVNDRFR